MLVLQWHQQHLHAVEPQEAFWYQTCAQIQRLVCDLKTEALLVVTVKSRVIPLQESHIQNFLVCLALYSCIIWSNLVDCQENASFHWCRLCNGLYTCCCWRYFPRATRCLQSNPAICLRCHSTREKLGLGCLILNLHEVQNSRCILHRLNESCDTMDATQLAIWVRGVDLKAIQFFCLIPMKGRRSQCYFRGYICTLIFCEFLLCDFWQFLFTKQSNSWSDAVLAYEGSLWDRKLTRVPFNHQRLYTSGSQPFPLKGANSSTTILLESCTKELLTQVNWHDLFHSRRKSVVQNNGGLLKHCWGPHKSCLGAACGPQNSGWEPLLYTILPALSGFGLSKLVSITAAPAMVGSTMSLSQLLTDHFRSLGCAQKVCKVHCSVHQELLCAKETGIKNIVFCSEVVEYIACSSPQPPHLQSRCAKLLTIFFITLRFAGSVLAMPWSAFLLFPGRSFLRQQEGPQRLWNVFLFESVVSASSVISAFTPINFRWPCKFVTCSSRPAKPRAVIRNKADAVRLASVEEKPHLLPLTRPVRWTLHDTEECVSVLSTLRDEYSSRLTDIGSHSQQLKIDGAPFDFPYDGAPFDFPYDVAVSDAQLELIEQDSYVLLAQFTFSATSINFYHQLPLTIFSCCDFLL